MSLTPEDGSGSNPLADTYATVAELRSFADKRGATLPANDGPGDAACEVLLIKAMDYLSAQSQRWKGERVLSDQPLDWPRYGAVVNGYQLPSDLIPPEIKRGQCQLAIEALTAELLPTAAVGQTGAVIEETVDVLTVKYAEPTSQRTQPVFARVDAFLAKFYGAGANQVRWVRG